MEQKGESGGAELGPPGLRGDGAAAGPGRVPRFPGSCRPALAPWTEEERARPEGLPGLFSSQAVYPQASDSF